MLPYPLPNTSMSVPFLRDTCARWIQLCIQYHEPIGAFTPYLNLSLKQLRDVATMTSNLRHLA